jgi:hypothetical protein
MSTTTALIDQQEGSNVSTAWPQPSTQNLDLIQIINSGDGQATLANVDYLGTVHYPALNPTNGTRVGVFSTNLTSSATLAQLFASAFANPAQLDILQVVNVGGNIHYSLNYLGVASGS